MSIYARVKPKPRHLLSLDYVFVKTNPIFNIIYKSSNFPTNIRNWKRVWGNKSLSMHKFGLCFKNLSSWLVLTVLYLLRRQSDSWNTKFNRETKYQTWEWRWFPRNHYEGSWRYWSRQFWCWTSKGELGSQNVWRKNWKNK